MALTAEQLQPYVLETYGPQDTWSDETRAEVERGCANWKASQPTEEPLTMPQPYEGAEAIPSGAVHQGFSDTYERGFEEKLEAGELGDLHSVIRDPLHNMYDTISGAKQMTPRMELAIAEGRDWRNMPSLQGAGKFLKTRIGTALSGGENDMQVIATNAGINLSDPKDVEANIQTDEKGNWYIRDKKDGQWYARQPGFERSALTRPHGNLQKL